MSETLTTAVSMPADFDYNEVPSMATGLAPTPQGRSPAAAPDLGFIGGIYRQLDRQRFQHDLSPDNPETPLPVPVTGSDNVLELNLTMQTLSFSKSLGSVPNRGSGTQGDIFLNGVPYLQTINDVTFRGEVTGIHFEPGMWVIVPKTTDPQEGPTLARMVSIPHGTMINAQGTFLTVNGPPRIAAVDITPSTIGGGTPVPFPRPDRDEPGNTANSAGSDRFYRGRHDHPGHPERSGHGIEKSNRRPKHRVHDGDHG